MHKEFVNRVVDILKDDDGVLGLAAGGSWIGGNMDEYSDVDLVLVTCARVSDDVDKMKGYAERLGKLLVAFTGEHVGEPRLLICLYDDPLLHVDIKFLITEELDFRVEDPVILLDKEGVIASSFSTSKPHWPNPDGQWLEDRFWIWVHYTALKIGRGEYFEAIDSLAYLRKVVLAPLMQLANGQKARGVRHVETSLSAEELRQLRDTLAGYEVHSIIRALHSCIGIYRNLRIGVFENKIILRTAVQEASLAYLAVIEKKYSPSA